MHVHLCLLIYKEISLFISGGQNYHQLSMLFTRGLPGTLDCSWKTFIKNFDDCVNSLSHFLNIIQIHLQYNGKELIYILQTSRHHSNMVSIIRQVKSSERCFKLNKVQGNCNHDSLLITVFVGEGFSGQKGLMVS